MRYKPITGDDEVDEIIRAAAKTAGRQVPDTIAARTTVPDAFARLSDLANSRVWDLAEAARRDAAPHVEFATRTARVVMIDDFHVGDTAIPENAAACAIRARARRLDLIDQVWQAEQRVESIADVHAAVLERLHRQFRVYLGFLDMAIRTTRGGQHLTYPTPTDIAISDDAFDVGLARIRGALSCNNTSRSHASHNYRTDTDTTEEGAA